MKRGALLALIAIIAIGCIALGLWLDANILSSDLPSWLKFILLGS